MSTIKFGRFYTAYDQLQSKDHVWEPAAWYDDMTSRAAASGRIQSSVSLGDVRAGARHEIMFIECGRPYYKIWPGMVEAMQTIDIDIGGHYLQSPFPVFEIRLPLNNTLRAGDGNCVVGILASIAPPEGDTIYREMGEKIIDPKDVTKIISLSYSFRSGESTRCDVPLMRGRTIREEMLRVGNDMPPDKRDIEASYKTSVELRVAILSVVIATSFFAVENHEVIMPDIPREVLTIKGKGKRKRITEQMRIDRELAKCKGWKVGSEIDLPRPLIRREGYSGNEGTGKELEHGHIRSGHMRMQPCGKGNKDRKLIFLPPTVVRPDLPMRTTRGYRIQDKLLAGSS